MALRQLRTFSPASLFFCAVNLFQTKRADQYRYSLTYFKEGCLIDTRSISSPPSLLSAELKFLK